MPCSYTYIWRTITNPELKIVRVDTLSSRLAFHVLFKSLSFQSTGIINHITYDTLCPVVCLFKMLSLSHMNKILNSEIDQKK